MKSEIVTHLLSLEGEEMKKFLTSIGILGVALSIGLIIVAKCV